MVDNIHDGMMAMILPATRPRQMICLMQRLDDLRVDKVCNWRQTKDGTARVEPSERGTSIPTDTSNRDLARYAGLVWTFAIWAHHAELRNVVWNGAESSSRALLVFRRISTGQ